MGRDTTELSRFLSFVLRHRPGAIGIELDSQGWVEVEALIEAAARSGRSFTREELEHVVATNDKKRFAFSPDGLMIRASQGHSVKIDLALKPVEPPAILYHGTATRFLKGIRREGLRSGSRRHVHLSADERTAVSVGSRHGVPAVLRVLAGRMYADGLTFYRSENGVWLTESVPLAYIQFP
jgi:putative RNA 2'-phosphotransferase